MSDLEKSGFFKADKVKELEKAKADVQRSALPKITRHLDKIIVGANVQPHYADRKEGEVWEDFDGKTWTKKDGLVQSISRFQKFKTPWFCPECGRMMDHELHEKMWRLRGKCHDCVVKDETRMRVEGTWEAYEKKLLRDNEKAFLNDKILEHETYIKEFKPPTVYFENGGYQVLAPKEEFEEIFQTLRKDIEFMKNRLKEIAREEENE